MSVKMNCIPNDTRFLHRESYMLITREPKTYFPGNVLRDGKGSSATHYTHVFLNLGMPLVYFTVLPAQCSLLNIPHQV